MAAGQTPVWLLARPVATDGGELPLVGSRVLPAGDIPAIWISEALRDLHGWQPGQRVDLPLAGRAVAVQG
ncbi:MAG: hypothetical protein CVU43_22345, partial [Chloroflexi bacterium HGW-Chloroflexi-5]